MGSCCQSTNIYQKQQKNEIELDSDQKISSTQVILSQANLKRPSKQHQLEKINFDQDFSVLEDSLDLSRSDRRTPEFKAIESQTSLKIINIQSEDNNQTNELMKDKDRQHKILNENLRIVSMRSNKSSSKGGSLSPQVSRLQQSQRYINSALQINDDLNSSKSLSQRKNVLRANYSNQNSVKSSSSSSKSILKKKLKFNKTIKKSFRCFASVNENDFKQKKVRFAKVKKVFQ